MKQNAESKWFKNERKGIVLIRDYRGKLNKTLKKKMEGSSNSERLLYL